MDISLLFKDQEHKKMNCDLVEDRKPGVGKRVVVGGLSLLFKDEYDQEPKKDYCNSSTTILGREENMIIVDAFSFACKDNDHRQKDVNCSSSTIMAEYVDESRVEDKKPMNNMDKYDQIRTNNNNYDDYAFRMPLHFPRYTKKQYEEMSEEKLDMLLQEYGLFIHHGDLDYKKQFAITAFLWPSTPCQELIAAEDCSKKNVINSILEYVCHALLN